MTIAPGKGRESVGKGSFLHKRVAPLSVPAPRRRRRTRSPNTILALKKKKKEKKEKRSTFLENKYTPSKIGVVLSPNNHIFICRDTQKGTQILNNNSKHSRKTVLQ